MKKILLSIVFLCLEVLLFGAISVSAETYGDLTYEIIDEEIIITQCNENASGELIIPNEIEGYPVTTIKDWAFYECASITSVTIPNNIHSIGNHIFYGCTKLTHINVIDENAKYSSQDGVLFNKDKTTLIQYPIGNLRANYFIPDSVTTVSSYAFHNCTKLTNISLSDFIISVESGAFDGCTRLSNIYVTENNTNYSSKDGVLFNKDKTILIQYPISNAKTNYTIPDSVVTINDHAFSHCSNLSNIVIPDSVTSIGNYSFNSCVNLTNIIIGKNVINIGDGAFEGCINLTSVTIPDNVISIGDWAFYYCWSLTDITLPNNITYIPDWTFNSCNNLSEVYFMGTEESWNEISVGYFNEPLFNSSIHFDILVRGISLDKDSIMIRKSHNESLVASITPYYATNQNILWTSSNPDVATVENGVLTGMGSGTAIITATTVDGNFSAKCEVISFSFEDDFIDYGIDENKMNWALGGCGTFEMIGIGQTVDYAKISAIPWYGERSDIKEIIIGERITHIGARSFYGCVNAEKVVIPPSVKSIGTYAFRNCDLMTIYGEKGSYAEIYALENDFAFVNTKKAEQPTLTIDIASNSLKWYFDRTINNYSGDGVVYIAIYNSNDEILTTTSEALVIDDITSIPLVRNSNATYAKIFVWDNNMQPIALSKIVEL